MSDMEDVPVAEERDPWMCVECLDDPRETPDSGIGYAHYDGDLCGYHYGKKMGYYAEGDDE